ncbi:hypothetical protein TSMEX_002087 [Taenia solium]|eukprot:TsM_000133900 transcript=TsM_000133900 gene=TsM_000133900
MERWHYLFDVGHSRNDCGDDEVGSALTAALMGMRNAESAIPAGMDRRGLWNSMVLPRNGRTYLGVLVITTLPSSPYLCHHSFASRTLQGFHKQFGHWCLCTVSRRASLH